MQSENDRCQYFTSRSFDSITRDYLPGGREPDGPVRLSSGRRRVRGRSITTWCDGCQWRNLLRKNASLCLKMH
jgi:hypothetical protein